jgi:Minichromosome loss protein, Mcl1, middle region
VRAGDSSRRFLAYNLDGCISTRADDAFNVVEVAFHDMQSRRRQPHFSDLYGFTLGALGEKASRDPPALICVLAAQTVSVYWG